MTFISFMGW